ncbi:MAG: hemerythrin family protein [Deltaproteobacteria bacterium]|nr:hemerythrin family protein [Deltaproteobacteria bacterium]
MHVINWNSKFNTGIEDIDMQHKALVEIFQTMEDNYGDENFGPTILFMKDYAEIHFATEEKLMIETQFPLYDAHRKLHDEFINVTEEYAERFLEGNVSSKEVTDFLFTWIVNHIVGTDAKTLVPHLLKIKEKNEPQSL